VVGSEPVLLWLCVLFWCSVIGDLRGADDGAAAAASGGGGGVSGGSGADPLVPCPPDQLSRAEMRLVSVSLDVVWELSAVRIRLPKDLDAKEGRKGVSASVAEIERRFKGKLPVLDAVKDMRIHHPDLAGLLERTRSVETRLQKAALHQATDRDARLDVYSRRVALADQAKVLKREARAVESLAMRDQLRRMRKVLRKLDHMSKDGVLLMKGRVACEINTADELIVTELMLSGTLSELSLEQLGALLSCVVYQDRRKDEGLKLKEELAAPFRKLQDAARLIAKLSVECKIDMDPEKYVNDLNPELMEVVYAWVKGAKFVDVVKLADQFEGTIIRVIRRLEELLRQLSSAAFVIGNTELKEKFDACADRMRRDIVFAASLYL